MMPRLMTLALVSALAAQAGLANCHSLAANEPPAGPIQVFLLAGQSNMEGKGWAEHIKNQNDDPALAEDFPRLYRDGAWVVRDDVWITYPTNAMRGGPRHGRLTVGYGTHRHEDVGDEIGPEFAIGHTLGDAIDAPVLLIKTAWGGKNVKVDFLPPTAGGPGPFYTAMIRHTREELDKLPETFPELANREYELAGLIWFQGFNDMVDREQRADDYADYTQRLGHLIRDVRKEFDRPELPVVIGELGTGGIPNRGSFQQAQAAVAKLDDLAGRVRFVPTAEYYDTEAHKLFEAGVWRDPDERHRFYSIAADRPYHYLGSGKTYYLMGKAMGQAMAELVQPPSP